MGVGGQERGRNSGGQGEVEVGGMRGGRTSGVEELDAVEGVRSHSRIGGRRHGPGWQPNGGEGIHGATDRRARNVAHAVKSRAKFDGPPRQ